MDQILEINSGEALLGLLALVLETVAENASSSSSIHVMNGSGEKKSSEPILEDKTDPIVAVSESTKDLQSFELLI